MAFPNSLDDFRRQWKEEINQRIENVDSTSGTDGHKKAQSLVLKRKSDEKSEIQPQNKLYRGSCDSSESSSTLQQKSTLEKGSTSFKCQYTSSTKVRFVDIFIQDLCEVDPIPFFDIELPREVALKIFKHLSTRDLCRCAQVSKSWQSLAEDELLWCKICHKYGYEEQATAIEKENWKEIVRKAVEMEDKLVYNWKNRVGGLDEMDYIPGGILTAVSSHQDWLVAGYTSLDVKLWDLTSETSCLLTPSSKALVLDNDGSFIQNYVTRVVVNSRHTFALYNTGSLNIWENNNKHLTPVHQSQHRHGKSRLCCSLSAPLIGIEHGSSIQLLAEKCTYDDTKKLQEMSSDQSDSEDGKLNHGDNEQESEKWNRIAHLNYEFSSDPGHIIIHNFLVVTKKSSFSSNILSDHLVISAVNDEVRVHDLSQDLDDPGSMTHLYHTAFAPVEIMDYRTTGELAIVSKVFEYSNFVTGGPNEIQLYDVEAKKKTVTFGPVSETIKVLNLKDSPAKQLLTAGYGVVHIYDERVGQSVQSLKDQILSPITQIQMDDWKVVTGNSSGYVSTWDRRMATKCWEMHNRHPVSYLCFRKNLLIAANIPSDLSPCFDGPATPEYVLHKRYRGKLSVLDFSVTQQRDELPSICQSTFDEPDHYNYNIRLAMPYDNL